MTADHPLVVNPEAIGDPDQQPIVQVPPDRQSTWRRLVNNNRRSLGLPPQCPCCEGDERGGARDLCDTCLAAALAGQFPHGCARKEGS